MAAKPKPRPASVGALLEKQKWMQDQKELQLIKLSPHPWALVE